jgi:hypothetical protein
MNTALIEPFGSSWYHWSFLVWVLIGSALTMAFLAETGGIPRLIG